MGWFARLFPAPGADPEPSAAAPAPSAPAVGLTALPIEVNPCDHAQARFAMYRADAIARDHEQRLAEGRPQHPEWYRMKAEAMMHAHMLLAGGHWARSDLDALERRLGLPNSDA
jgi:hypothetical protein